MDLFITIGGILLFVLGFVLGKLADRDVIWRHRDRDLFFWNCPECPFKLEMHDQAKAIEVSNRHLKSHGG